MKKKILNAIKFYGPILIILVIILIGLNPIRRVLKPIIPDILESKVNVNSICDGNDKFYVFSTDNGGVSVILVAGGCNEINKGIVLKNK